MMMILMKMIFMKVMMIFLMVVILMMMITILIMKLMMTLMTMMMVVAGPPAVVQINMWQQGDVVMSQLTDRLILAMKHAVCDIIMEYRLLTAPLCEVPEHYVKGVDSPLHSAPPSPVLTHSTGGS